jgi:UDP-GlcNAc:undecaprenyl-phosphate GlcNAc-1-phosphate transferase
MIMEMAAAFLVAFLVTFVLAPAMIPVAVRLGAVDQPEARKIHCTPTPRLGGLSVFGGFVLSTLLAVFVLPVHHTAEASLQYNWPLLTASLFLVVALGMWDDIRTLGAGIKFVIQVVLATMVCFSGVTISKLSIPFDPGLIELGVFAYPATILWVVAVTNAFNLIDGLDGLASGVSVIASLTIFAIAFMLHDHVTMVVSLALAGAAAGFLPYNFNPARIFLGDTGSLLLGFLLSVLSIHSSTKGSTAFPILVPLLVFGLPIFDTALSMVRRALRRLMGGKSTNDSVVDLMKAMFRPDKKHIHHQLLAKGLSQRAAVVIMYLVSCLLGLTAIIITVQKGSTLPLLLVGVMVVAGIKKLDYGEMAVFKNGVLLSLFGRPLSHSGIYRRGADVFLVIVAIAGSYLFTATERVSSSVTTDALLFLLASLVQAAILAMYDPSREANRVIAMGDILRTMKAVAMGVLVSGLVMHTIATLTNTATGMGWTFWVLDLYFLATLVVGSHTAFHVLNYLFRREQRGGTRVLIYGANSLGLLTLQKILNYDAPLVEPIGFLDDDPKLEGRRLHGYPIFGGHWKLNRILNTHHIHAIILSDQYVRPEVFRRIWSSARARGVALRRARIGLEDVRTDVTVAQPELVTHAV